MPVIPMPNLPMANQGAPHYGRAQAPDASYYRNAAPGAQLAANLAGVAEKAAGLWLQANLKARESKAAMDLDEIRVKAEAAYRDNMTALSQDPDGYETFGDRSQKNFLALRQDCRELLDGLPAEHRRKAELYLTGQATRWRDDTSRLQYQARVTALDARGRNSIQSQLDANDWDGARATALSLKESQVWSQAQYDKAVQEIGHSEAWSGALAWVKANPARAAELLEVDGAGAWKVDKPGLNPQDRERLARHGEALCKDNAAALREQMASDPENFDMNAVDGQKGAGLITDRDAQSLSAAHQAYRDRASARSFDYAMQEGTAFDTVEKVEAAREALKDDQSLPALERERRDAALAVHALRLKSRAEAEATKEQSEFYSEQKMRILYPGLFGDGAETVTYEDVMGWAKAKKLTYGQAYDLLHTGMSIRERREEAARQLTTRQAKVQCTSAIAETEVPSDPAERQALFQKKDGDLFNVFFATSPETYAALRKELEERFSPDPKGWRANEALKAGWEGYLDEQREKDFFSVRTVPLKPFAGDDMGAFVPASNTVRDLSRQGESFRRWEGEMLEWLARHPKATEKELREYGDALRMKINAAHVGGELDELFQAEYANLRKYDIRRGK